MRKLIWILLFLCALLPVNAADPAEKKGSARPASTEVKNQCVDCHQGLAGNLKKPVDDWHGSVHSGPGKTCSFCHGGDPGALDKVKAKKGAVPFVGRPARKQIPDFCGREGCHGEALGHFKRGPHYLSVIKKDEPNCVTCHRSHNIEQISSATRSEKSCTPCHSAEFSRDIISMIEKVDSGINKIDFKIKYLRGKHLDVKVLETRLASVRHLFHVLVHVFSRQEMETSRAIITMEVTNLDADTRTKVSLIQRMDILYIIMVSFGLIIIFGISIYTLVMYSKRRK